MKPGKNVRRHVLRHTNGDLVIVNYAIATHAAPRGKMYPYSSTRQAMRIARQIMRDDASLLAKMAAE